MHWHVGLRTFLITLPEMLIYFNGLLRFVTAAAWLGPRLE